MGLRWRQRYRFSRLGRLRSNLSIAVVEHAVQQTFDDPRRLCIWSGHSAASGQVVQMSPGPRGFEYWNKNLPESSPFRTLANCQSGAGGRFGWLTGRGVAGYEATKNGSVISVCGSETIAKADRGYCPCGRRSALSHPDNSSIAPKAESEKGLHSVPAHPARNSNQSRS